MKGMLQPRMRRTMMRPLVAMFKTAGMLRRATNHNAHVLTRHGHLMLGRKGRTGRKPH